MKVSYENDGVTGPGYGVLRCADEAFGTGEYTFSLARASDHAYLGENDWGTQRVALRPADQRIENGELLLFLRPDVVNQLDVQENYRFFLQDTSGGTSFSSGLRVSDVVYAPAPEAKNILPPPAAPSKPQEATPEDVGTEPPAAEPDTADPGDAETPQKSDTPQGAPLSLQQPETAGKKSSVPLTAGVLLLVLILIGAGVWWFTFKDTPAAPSANTGEPLAQKQETAKPDPAENATPKEAPKPATKPEQPAEAPKPTEPQPAAPAPAPAAPAAQPRSAEQRVTIFFGNKERSPQEAAALSRQLPTTTSADQDAVYRLYYFASENGDPSVQMEYAASLDPSQSQWGTINKDAPAAWDIYEKAKAAHPQAAEAQRRLKAWLENEAGKGDVQARQWLKELQ